jgi:type II secretory pathway pseudopilin PulG
MSKARANKRPGEHNKGFSTLGMIVALVLLGFMLSSLLRTVMTAQKGFVANRDRARATSSARYAHLSLTRFMRNAGASPLGLPVQAIDPDPLANGSFDNVRLRADFNPPDGDISDPGEDLIFFVRADTMFVRSGLGGSDEPYLIGVDSLAFEYFDRDGVLISDPAKVPDDALSVRVTLRARGDLHRGTAVRVLTGRVRLRNER